MDEQRRNCGNCRFSHFPQGFGYDGECRRHAPVRLGELVTLQGAFRHRYAEPVWPIIGAHHFCGEHEPIGTSVAG